MLRPERMSRATILCRNDDAPTVTKLLARLRVLHIVDHKKQTVGTSLIDIGTPSASAEMISAALLTTKTLITKLGQYKGRQAPIACTIIELSTIIERVTTLGTSYAEHEQDISTLQHALQKIEQQQKILALLPETDDPIETLFQTKRVTTFLIQETKKSVKSTLSVINALRVVEKQTHNQPSTVLITVSRHAAEDVKEMLLGADYMMLDLAPLSSFHGTQHDAAQQLNKQKNILLHEQQRTQNELESFAEHLTFFEESEPLLTLELLKAQAPLHFGRTKKITLIQGYVPEHRSNELDAKLHTLGKTILAEYTVVARTQHAPIALNNPLFANNFEELIRLYNLPTYKELDPTSLIAFTFPLFFGFMLGDIGYGLCALVFFLYVRHRWESVKSSILFGFFFGEFFGFEQIFGHHLTPFIHRAEDIGTMFTIAIGAGILHINLGFVLGIINELEEGVLFAFLHKGSWILLQIGAYLLAGYYGLLNNIPHIGEFIAASPIASVQLYTSIAFMTAAIVGLWFGEKEHGILKAQGIFEIPMLISNTLSYARLVAIGLASVYLAFVVNDLAGGLFVKGGFWIVLGILLLLVGHTFNLLLGMLGPFLHSLRLHYVEFFTKFYRGGGKQYRPFGEVNA